MEERYERLERSRDPRDGRLDQWLETGRQLVDGVAGRRPGKRRAGLGLDSVGRWVGDKVEWLLEEDDDWREPWQDSAEPKARRKQPLQAISRRPRQRSMPAVASKPSTTAAPSTQSSSVAETSAFEDWPNDDQFQVQRWQRDPAQRSSPQGEPQDQPPSARRGLPRSSRRRA